MLKIILLKINRFVNFSRAYNFLFPPGRGRRVLAMAGFLNYNSPAKRLWPVFLPDMKNEFAFLYPPAGNVHFKGLVLDMRSLCFPLEIFKKYGFLFDHFSVKNRNRGLEIIFQERSDLAGEEYTMDCAPGRIVLGASQSRGQFYAVSTLLQILAFHEAAGRLPAFSLRDAPQIAFRGFLLGGGAENVPTGQELRRLLLRLALLKFNHVALPAAVLARTVGSVQERDDCKALAVQARVMGMEIIWVDSGDQAVFSFASGPPAGKIFFDPPVFPAAEGVGATTRPAAWFDFFLSRHRQGRDLGRKTAAWGDIFLRHGEWIRKIPQGVLVFNRGTAPGRSDLFKTTVQPFKKHHIPQVLCPVLCDRGRFIPDARAGMDRVREAYTAARAGKLAGVMPASGDPEGGCLPEGAAMLHFQAGCLLWSGHPPGPAAFSLWALGRDEPDLFRVYSFLAQAEHRLPHAHGRYLFEDPLFAPFSSQGDPREIEAHFHKAALYLEKRALAGGELAGFITFCRCLYEFIAVKVRFSARLGSFLREENGLARLRRQAAGLQEEALKLKDLHGELYSQHFQPAGLPHGKSNFDLLSERFASLIQAACRPAGREELLAELKNEPPPESQTGFPDAGF
jgi:hypothetical protein